MTYDDVLQVDEAAKLLDCSEDTVNMLADRRELPALKFGRSWVFPREALLSVLNERALEAMNTKQVDKGGVVVPLKSAGPKRAKPPVLEPET